MDPRLHLIDHLYGETTEDTPPLSELLRDPEAKAEYRAMSEIRFALDRRKRLRPERATIDAIVAAASPTERPTRANPWMDRLPLARLGSRPRRMAIPALAIAAVLAVTLWMQPWGPTAPSFAPATLADSSQEMAPPESLLRALPPAPPLQAMAKRADAPASNWEQGEDLRRISRRIEALKASGELSWDEPAVPLELLPTGQGGSLTPAGIRP